MKKKTTRIAAAGLGILAFGALTFAVGWYWSWVNQSTRSALVQASHDLIVLDHLANDEPSEAREFLERKIEAHAIVAGIALSDRWTPSSDKRIAECLLARFKKYREAQPTLTADADSESFLARLLDRDFRCRSSAT